MTDPQERPALRIVGGGAPTDEEVAALVVAFSTLASRGDADTVAPGRWAASSRAGSSWVRSGWVAAARRSALRTGR